MNAGESKQCHYGCACVPARSCHSSAADQRLLERKVLALFLERAVEQTTVNKPAMV